MAVKRFLNEIVRFLVLKKGNFSNKFLKNLAQEIRTLFLECYSETEKNLNVFHYLKYGKATKIFGLPIIGFKVKKQDILISEILNTVENIEDIPNEIKEDFPNLTCAQWSAVLRMTTVLLLEFEYRRKKK
jgi:hypothetical protein